MSETKGVSGRYIPGFSERLNQLLESAGFPERGRANRFAKLTAHTRVQAGKWLKGDLVPNDLGIMVEKLLDEMDSLASVASTVKWLKTGDKDYDPRTIHSDHRGIDYTLLARVLTSTHAVAQELGIEMERLPDETLDAIYFAVMRRLRGSRRSGIDKTVIRDLLSVACVNYS